jgi:hypothetical protein
VLRGQHSQSFKQCFGSGGRAIARLGVLKLACLRGAVRFQYMHVQIWQNLESSAVWLGLISSRGYVLHRADIEAPSRLFKPLPKNNLSLNKILAYPYFWS